MTTPTTPTTSAHEEPLDSFDLALLTELRAEVAARAAAPRRPARPARRRTLTAAGIAAVAAAAFGISSLGSSGAAYAVDRSSSGDITITITRLDDASGLQKALAADGIKAHVSYQPMTDSNGGIGVGAPVGAAPPNGQSGSVTNGHPEGSAPLSGGKATQGQPPANSPCGDPDHPALDGRLTGSSYVITIPADSPLHAADAELMITTTGAVADSVAGIAVEFSVAGTTCGMGTVSASSVGR